MSFYWEILAAVTAVYSRRTKQFENNRGRGVSRRGEKGDDVREKVFLRTVKETTFFEKVLKRYEDLQMETSTVQRGEQIFGSITVASLLCTGKSEILVGECNSSMVTFV